MTTINFFKKTRRFFPNRIWHWLIIALSEDPVIWKELTSDQSVLFGLALKKLPAQIEKWSPASLGLLLIASDLPVEYLVKTPLEKIDDNLLQRAVAVYDNWRNKPYYVEQLDKACLIA